jgi:hypothetical protein
LLLGFGINFEYLLADCLYFDIGVAPELGEHAKHSIHFLFYLFVE